MKMLGCNQLAFKVLLMVACEGIKSTALLCLTWQSNHSGIGPKISLNHAYIGLVGKESNSKFYYEHSQPFHLEHPS